MAKTDAVPNWKRGKSSLCIWLRAPLKKKLKEEARARDIPLRRLIDDILSRAAQQL